VPGKHIVAGRAPGDHPENASAHLALRHAFGSARRQLREHAQQSGGGGKRRTATAMG
jgi:hypothetical protein